MLQPPIHGTPRIIIEALFAKRLQDLLSESRRGVLDADVFQLLSRAWQRLQRSGVLEACHVEASVQTTARSRSELTAAVKASAAAPGLRTCALAGCGAREAHPAHFKSCSACRAVVYCCQEHNVEGWPAHRKACKAACKAAAAEKGGAGPSSA